MSMRQIAWLGLFFVVASQPLPLPGTEPGRPLGLTLRPGTTELVITGAQPGGPVAWFGVEREIDSDYSSARRSRQGVAVAGVDGVAHIELDPPPAARALWVAVDLASGDFVGGAPEGYRLIRLVPDKVPCRAEARDGEGADDALVDERQQIEGLMVRPAVGAWRFAGGDGGPDDDDKTHDGKLHLPLAAFWPLGSSPKAPGKVETRDLWLVIDPMSMDLSVLQGGVAR
jgi:hypothetical protein